MLAQYTSVWQKSAEMSTKTYAFVKPMARKRRTLQLQFLKQVNRVEH
jgi:hypothetical protein